MSINSSKKEIEVKQAPSSALELVEGGPGEWGTRDLVPSLLARSPSLPWEFSPPFSSQTDNCGPGAHSHREQRQERAEIISKHFHAFELSIDEHSLNRIIVGPSKSQSSDNAKCVCAK